MTLLPLPRRQRRALTDSSAYLALLDRRDRNHPTAVGILEWLADEGYRLYTTSTMLVESRALILSVLGGRVATEFLRSMESSSTVVIRVRASDEARARAIIYRYDDKTYSYNDAISFAVMERLGLEAAFTFDSDCRQYRLTVLSPPRSRP